MKDPHEIKVSLPEVAGGLLKSAGYTLRVVIARADEEALTDEDRSNVDDVFAAMNAVLAEHEAAFRGHLATRRIARGDARGENVGSTPPGKTRPKRAAARRPARG